MGKKAVSAGALLLLSVFLMAAGCGSSQQSDSSYQTAFPEPVYDCVALSGRAGTAARRSSHGVLHGTAPPDP